MQRDASANNFGLRFFSSFLLFCLLVSIAFSCKRFLKIKTNERKCRVNKVKTIDVIINVLQERVAETTKQNEDGKVEKCKPDEREGMPQRHHCPHAERRDVVQL
jgi:hypothetical protein